MSATLTPQTIWSAACCGGGLAAPSIISGDDRAQFSSSFSFTEILIDNVDARGIWRSWDEHQKIQSLRIDAAHLISDRWQVGMSLPIVQKTQLNTKRSGLGDLALTIAYEILPDWDYNPIRPKGIAYSQLTLPTGQSRFESEVGGLDSYGTGFLAFGIGSLLTKTVGDWDFYSQFEVHRMLEKSIATSQMRGKLQPGYGGNFSLAAGYNLASWRFGATLGWTYEDPIQFQGSSKNEGSIERFATAGLSISYLTAEDWSGTFSVSDQTLFGSPINTSLGRTASVQVQKRWRR